MQSHLKRVESAIKELQQGRVIILTDHPDREDEGDFIFPAETITPNTMNFIIRHSCGIVCLSMLNTQLKKLNLAYMVHPDENTSVRGTPFTISVDAKEGITTGVSASDRVTTIKAAIATNAEPHDLVRPGHIFPLYARDHGVLERDGHTEGGVDIVRLAGFKPAAVLCEVMNADGTMARGEKLRAFAKKHRIKMLSIADIIGYRLSRENLIEDKAEANLPLTSHGVFKMIVIKEKIKAYEHVVLIKKNKKLIEPTLVRIHSSCLTGDLFSSMRCDCNQQLNYSLERISKEGGILIYLNQEGRGIGLFNKIKAYALQEKGLDTIEANVYLGLPVDARDYSIAANVLRNFGIAKIRLLTNNPAKMKGLEKYGIEVKRESIPVFCRKENKNYLKTKKEKFHHLILLIIKQSAMPCK